MKRALLVAVMAFTVLFPTLAHADNSYEACFRARTNGERTSRGIDALLRDAEIDVIAREHSDRMARDGTIYHNENLSKEYTAAKGGYEYGGENVGMGPNCDAIQNAFMSSPGHRENILDRDYTYVGIGVTFDSATGTLYVTIDFFTPKASAPPPTNPKPKVTPKPTCTCPR